MADPSPPVDPLLSNVRISNEDGTPTPEFLRQWQQILRLVTAANGGIDSITANQQAIAALQNINLEAGVGLDGGGDLTEDRTFDLSNTAVTPGTFGDASNVAQITVDAQGRITTAEDVAIAGGGGSFDGVRATRSNTLSLVNTNTFTDMLFNAEDFDTNNFHDNVTNTARITIPDPTSITRAMFFGAIRFTSVGAATNVQLRVRQNNTTTVVEQRKDPIGTFNTIEVASGPVDVSAGDFFTLNYAISSTGAATALVAGTFFSMMVVDTS